MYSQITSSLSSLSLFREFGMKENIFFFNHHLVYSSSTTKFNKLNRHLNLPTFLLYGWAEWKAYGLFSLTCKSCNGPQNQSLSKLAEKQETRNKKHQTTFNYRIRRTKEHWLWHLPCHFTLKSLLITKCFMSAWNLHIPYQTLSSH